MEKSERRVTPRKTVDEYRAEMTELSSEQLLEVTDGTRDLNVLNVARHIALVRMNDSRVNGDHEETFAILDERFGQALDEVKPDSFVNH